MLKRSCKTEHKTTCECEGFTLTWSSENGSWNLVGMVAKFLRNFHPNYSSENAQVDMKLGPNVQETRLFFSSFPGKQMNVGVLLICSVVIHQVKWMKSNYC